jgi:hypothetical protein
VRGARRIKQRRWRKLELTWFCGQVILQPLRGGHDAEVKTAIVAGVPAQDRRVSSRRSQSQRARQGVRVLSADHPQLGRPGRRRRGQRDELLSSNEREECASYVVRTGGLSSSARSWQRPRPGSHGRPLDARPGFEFVRANQAAYPVATLSAAGVSTRAITHGSIVHSRCVHMPTRNCWCRFATSISARDRRLCGS